MDTINGICAEYCGRWIAEWIAEHYPNMKGSRSLVGIDTPNMFEAFHAGWRSYRKWNDTGADGREKGTAGEFWRKESERNLKKYQVLMEFCLGYGMTIAQIEEGCKNDG
jgi:hypothetical protein